MIGGRKFIGLDISDQKIEIVEILEKKNEISINSANKLRLNKGIVERGHIIDRENLKIILNKIFSEAKPFSIIEKNIVTCIQDCSVYTHNFDIEYLNEDELIEKINLYIKERTPIDDDNIVYSYRILSKKEKINQKIEEDSDVPQAYVSNVSSISVDRKIINDWQSFFNTIGIKAEFDLEPTSIFRSLFKDSLVDPVCIVDIGSYLTNISFFGANGLLKTYAYNEGGNAITDDFVEKFSINIEEAEKLKKNTNIIGEGAESEMLKSSFFRIIREVKIIIDHFNVGRENKIKEVVIVGGTSKIKGLKKYLSSQTGEYKLSLRRPWIETGEPFYNYVEAIGLALKKTKINNNYNNPDIPYVIEDKNHNFLNNFKKFDFKFFNFKNDKNKDSRSNLDKKKILIFLLVLCFIFIPYAFYVENKRQQKKQEVAINFDVNKEVVKRFKLNPKKIKNDNEIRARLVSTDITQTMKYDDMIYYGLRIASFNAEKDEEVWNKPINQIDSENIIYPIKLSFLVYNKKDFDLSILAFINKELRNINYELEKTLIKAFVIEGEDSYIDVSIDLLLDKNIDIND